MMPGGEEEKLSHHPHHSHDTHADHHHPGVAVASMARGGPPIQEPIPRHAPPRHSWAQTGGRGGGAPHNHGAPPPYYHHHHHGMNNGPPPPPPYHRDASNMIQQQSQQQHHGHAMMQHHGHADAAGYPPPPPHHHHQQMMHPPPPHQTGGNYFPSSQPPPGAYYGGHSSHHPEQGPPPPPPMNQSHNYYQYGGGHAPPPHHHSHHHHSQYHHHARPPDPMEYQRGGEQPQQHGGYHHHHHQMQYNHQHPGHYPEQPYNVQSSMDPSYNMYPNEAALRQPAYQLSSSFSVDSRSTLGHADSTLQPPGGGSMNSGSRKNRRLSYPSHIALRSIADDTTKTPSPPPIPPPPPGTIHEPHEISAPSSLDETDVGAPLRQSALLNRIAHHPSNAYAATTDGGGEGLIPAEMGSSEKKETLDTASVLLAFSSTKKRPASTTSTLDDTDALSLATMSTLPHSIAPPDHSNNVTFCPPTEYPKRLAMPEDKERLNQLHCFMRSELLEVVVIQPADGSKETDSFSKTPTSSDPLQIGRVGLRCVHCSMSADGGRTGPSMSIFYPKSTGEIYRLVTSWKRCHLSKCKNIPKSIRDELSRLNEVKARGKTSYWTESAAQLGLVNMPTKIGGICFSPTAESIGRSDSLTPAKLTATMPLEQTTVTTTDSHSPGSNSLPTISDTSTLVTMAREALIKPEHGEEHNSNAPRTTS